MIERIINDEIPVGPSFESYNDSTDFLSLHIDRIRVHVGNDVTGNVSSIGEPNTKVVVELEGTEYTVVALPGMSKDELDAVSAQDLKKTTLIWIRKWKRSRNCLRKSTCNIKSS